MPEARDLCTHTHAYFTCLKRGRITVFYEIGLLVTNRPILEGSDFCLPAGFLRHFFLDDRWEDELALADPYV